MTRYTIALPVCLLSFVYAASTRAAVPPGDSSTPDSITAELLKLDCCCGILPQLQIPPNPTFDPMGIDVRDIALQTGFQDHYFGHFNRGRALVAADFDLDGWIDFYLGNPNDESFVIRNLGIQDSGEVAFGLVQLLVSNDYTWGGSSGDYDNDGDYDLYISCGANEGIAFDYLFQNQLVETGALSFVDVTATAGIAGPVPPGETEPIPIASANGVWGDYDRDGDVDLFVNGNIHQTSLPQLIGRNVLWRNNGDGTFTDVTVEVGMGDSIGGTRHSTFLDIDNDGDLDLYENNMASFNKLWRNELVEQGSATFTDVTAEFSPEGQNLSYPQNSFASTTADINNDGWQDIMVWVRGAEPPGSPYGDGDAVFINQGGTGFVNMADEYAINGGPCSLIVDTVMGCQLGDINNDGVMDAYTGNGGPYGTDPDFLHLSIGAGPSTPLYEDISCLIDFAAPQADGVVYPPYPYRTHGTCMVDVDNDGNLEIAVSNGGPYVQSDDVQEPNRLFKFSFPEGYRSTKVLCVGDGRRVSWDAIGTRVAMTVRNSVGQEWTLYRTVLGGSAFSAQNGFELHFGLRDAVEVLNIVITWPDGGQSTWHPEVAMPELTVVTRGPIFYADNDVRVDLEDYAVLSTCLGGPDAGLGKLPCAVMDGERDGDIDLRDFARMANLFE